MSMSTKMSVTQCATTNKAPCKSQVKHKASVKSNRPDENKTKLNKM